MKNRKLKRIIFYSLLLLLPMRLAYAGHAEYNDIFFIDKKTGWVVGFSFDVPGGHFMYKTINGGQTWFPIGDDIFQNTSSRIEYIYFISDQIGWVVLDQSRIYQTKNGGDTWNCINSEITPGDLFFLNENNGWGTYFEYDESFESHSTIIRTHDGGITWVPDTVSQYIDIYLYEIDFFDSLNGVGVGGGLFETASYVAQTYDGGETWHSNVSWGSSSLYDVDYVSEERVWCVGGHVGSGSIFCSMNGVENPWPIQYYSHEGPFVSIQFSDSLCGWAAGGEIVRTIDGGQNWECMRILGNGHYVQSFFGIDSLNAWFSYKDSLLYTTDGGVSWHNNDILSGVIAKAEPINQDCLKIYPNPFNNSTNIDYYLNRPSYLNISIYNVYGRLVKVLFNGYQCVGSYNVTWDGVDDSSNHVSSGLYICILNYNNVFINRPLILIK